MDYFHFNPLDIIIISQLITSVVLSSINSSNININICIEPEIIWLSFSVIISIALRLALTTVILKKFSHKIMNFICYIAYLPLLAFWIFKVTYWLRKSVDFQPNCTSSFDLIVLAFFLTACYSHFVYISIFIVIRIMDHYFEQNIVNLHDEIDDIYNNSQTEYLNIDYINQIIERNNLNPNDICISNNEFNRLPKKELNSRDMENSKITTCSICCEEFGKTEKVIFFKECKHVFHTDCIKDWLNRKPICPNCKRNVRNEIVKNVQVERRGNYT